MAEIMVAIDSFRRSRWQYLAVVGCALLALWLVRLYVQHLHMLAEFPLATDFYKFYLSGERLWQGMSMYWQMPPRLVPGDPCFFDGVTHGPVVVGPGPMCLHPNLNPPFFAILAGPLAAMDYDSAWVVWSAASAASGGLAIALMTREFNGRWRLLPVVWASVGFFAFYPTWTALSYGQVTLFLMLLLVLGWRALRRAQELPAGLWLGLAMSLKPFVGLLWLALLLRGHVRAAMACAATVTCAALIGLLAVGWDDHLDYLRIAGDVTWLDASWNASFAGYYARILGGGENPAWLQAPEIARVLTATAALGALSLIVLLLRRTQHWHRLERVDAMFALVLPAMLLISPLGWLYYFPILGLTLAVYWRLLGRTSRSWRWRGLLAGLVLLAAIPRVLQPARDMNHLSAWLWDGALYHYLLLGLFALGASALWSLTSPARHMAEDLSAVRAT